MLLSARPLNHCTDVNSYEMVPTFSFTKGDALDIYFVLIDLSLDRANQGYNPAGRRYIPEAAATLSVVFANIDTSKEITRTATNPFANDTSIWKVSILATDALAGTVSMKLVLTEPTGPKITYGGLQGALRIVGFDPVSGC